MGRRSATRLRTRLRTAAVLVGVMGLAVMPSAAHASLLKKVVKTTTGVVERTVQGTTGVVDGTVGALPGVVGGTVAVVDGTVTAVSGVVDGLGLLDTGWRYDETTTELDHVAQVVGATQLWRAGVTGRGVDVAVVDTGIAPVGGLAAAVVVNGPDLSFESQVDELRHRDTFGHGTHMAGIVAGRDDATGFRGLAPDAGVVALKVGVVDGAVDVSQVIAAIDWVVANRRTDGLNIRVLNLAYGTDSSQDPRVDPLAHAVESAWRAGIVVVASGGNDGAEQPRLDSPAVHPGVIAVGAADTRGTTATLDDTVLEFSARGAAGRRVDLVAPGRSIASLRSPGSAIDAAHPEARVGEHLVKGSGTSQAAAVVSGAAALLLQHRPALTPDQVKVLLTATAAPLPAADPAGRGAGMLDVAAAAAAPRPLVVSRWTPTRGTGSLDAARGSARVADDDVDLDGERTVRGPWAGASWPLASATGTAWRGGRWVGDGATWTGTCFCGSSWTARTWAATPWEGTTWGGASWSSRSWRDDGWSSRSWRSRSWRGSSWSGT